MKYKAKDGYANLKDSENFLSMKSASRHIMLCRGKEIEWEGKLPKKLKDSLIEQKDKE
tara:strand:- start:477 stop:650 length:174 start_codon:yes stop_codon:yes gene_type:complete